MAKWLVLGLLWLVASLEPVWTQEEPMANWNGRCNESERTPEELVAVSRVRKKVDHNLLAIPYDPEIDMTVPELITHRGYPVETHEVTTEDGYILQLHRIPYGRNGRRKFKSRPVFLQHGVLNTAAVWILNPSHNSLAFLLADAGFDVWMGNARGNTYSRRHVDLDPDEYLFWEFTWDHLGYFDIPACIEYVLKITKQPKLVYIGHSLGTAEFFIAMSLRPELNSKIELMVALAPISSVAHSTTPTKLSAPFVRPITFFMDLFYTGPVLDSDAYVHKIRHFFCHRNLLQASVCRDLIFKFIGANPKNFDLYQLPLINSHVMEGTSYKVMAQFAHNHNAGETFIPFDYGKAENLKRYGSESPPPYDLSLVTAPVYLYYGRNDPISTTKDVLWLAQQLGNLQGVYEVDDPKFNHWDFLWSLTTYDLLYHHILGLLTSHHRA